VSGQDTRPEARRGTPGRAAAAAALVLVGSGLGGSVLWQRARPVYDPEEVRRADEVVARLMTGLSPEPARSSLTDVSSLPDCFGWMVDYEAWLGRHPAPTAAEARERCRGFPAFVEAAAHGTPLSAADRDLVRWATRLVVTALFEDHRDAEAWRVLLHVNRLTRAQVARGDHTEEALSALLSFAQQLPMRGTWATLDAACVEELESLHAQAAAEDATRAMRALLHRERARTVTGDGTVRSSDLTSQETVYYLCQVEEMERMEAVGCGALTGRACVSALRELSEPGLRGPPPLWASVLGPRASRRWDAHCGGATEGTAVDLVMADLFLAMVPFVLAHDRRGRSCDPLPDAPSFEGEPLSLVVSGQRLRIATPAWLRSARPSVDELLVDLPCAP